MQCVSTRTTVSIFLYFRRDKALQSEPAPQLYSRLHRPSFLHKSVPHTLKIERSILFVQCIAHPEINLSMSFLEADTSVQRAVEGLAHAILSRSSRCVRHRCSWHSAGCGPASVPDGCGRCTDRPRSWYAWEQRVRTCRCS